MARPLTIVTRPQGANRALIDGEVRPDGVALEFVDVPVLVQGFRRMVRTLEFDVCEMALTTYLCAKEHGVAFTALPIFLVRGFHHNAIGVAKGSGVSEPAALAGTRVGVSRGYTVTTGVWARGILEQEYGLDLSSITWVLSGDEHVAQYQPPPNVVAKPANAELEDLVLSGELSAIVGAPTNDPRIVPLIPEAEDAGFEALRQRGHYPINHLVVVRDDVLAERPEVATELFAAFAAAKDAYVAQLGHGEVNNGTDRMYRRVMDIVGGDPMPYGIAPNRLVLDELIDHAMRQGILTRRPDLAEVFGPGASELVG